MKSATIAQKPHLHILIAYPYVTREMLQRLEQLRAVCDVTLMLDSGAFTAWNTGKTISFHDYCAFVRNPPTHFDHVAQLDVFGDAEGTWANYQTMRERDLPVMPVFTRGDSVERLNAMYEDSDYVLFGGIVTGSKNREYLRWFQQQNGQRKVHWLGFIRKEFIAYYRPFSADSSTWYDSMKFGNSDIYVGKGICRKVTWGDCAHPTPRMRQLLAHHGFDGPMIDRLRQRKEWRGGRAISLDLAAAANVLRAQALKARYGTNAYFCVSCAPHLEALARMVPRVHYTNIDNPDNT